MKKRYFVCLLVSLFLIPGVVFASEVEASDDDFVLVSEETKYYKTITPIFSSSDSQSVTYEITKEEYDTANVEQRSNPTTYETTYKSMTSSILANGSYYRYKNVLNWKNIPATRSYDIIGIGFYQTVKVHNNTTHFSQYYCYSSGAGCFTTTTNYPQIFVGGAGTSFKLPTGNLSTLQETFYFDVEKNTTGTITTQKAYADYSHATTSVSLTDSKKYSVDGSGGIYLNSSISSYYDAMSTAIATWNGSW